MAREYRRGMRAVCFLVLVACGGSEEKRAQTDAKPSDGPIPIDGAVAAVECNKTFKQTTVDANGRETEVRRYFAVFDNVHPGDSFVVELCDLLTSGSSDVPACPVGATCSGDPLPTGRECYVERGGTFYDGKLFVQCGSGFTRTDAQGTLLDSGERVYQSLRVY